jgi:hypothetical protein
MNLQGSDASGAKILQSQNRQSAKIRLSVNHFRVVHGRQNMVPAGLHIIESGALPALHDTEIALLATGPMSKPAERLREHIVSSLERPKISQRRPG